MNIENIYTEKINLPCVIDVFNSGIKLVKNRLDSINCIYKITSISGKIYVGLTTDLENRFYYYKKIKCKNQRLSRIGKKQSPETISKRVEKNKIIRQERLIMIF